MIYETKGNEKQLNLLSTFDIKGLKLRLLTRLKKLQMLRECQIIMEIQKITKGNEISYICLRLLLIIRIQL